MEVKITVIKQLERTFNLLAEKLPEGWIITTDKQQDIIELFGPSSAKIVITSIRKGKLSVIGKWPETSNGDCMDPYSWGVLDYNDEYPFVKLNSKQKSENQTKGILNYIGAYNYIYERCLIKASSSIL